MLERLLVKPVVDLRLMTGEEDVRNAPAFVLSRAGIDSGFEQTVLEGVGERGCLVAKGSREQPYDGIGHDGGRHLTAGEDEVADSIFLGDEVIAHALVNAFVMSAEDDQILLHGELVGHLLVEAFAIGGGEDDLVVVALGSEFGDEAVDRRCLSRV